jgi:hypothetical protein
MLMTDPGLTLHISIVFSSDMPEHVIILMHEFLNKQREQFLYPIWFKQVNGCFCMRQHT